jgi:thiamine pyrophosphokinase
MQQLKLETQLPSYSFNPSRKRTSVSVRGMKYPLKNTPKPPQHVASLVLLGT